MVVINFEEAMNVAEEKWNSENEIKAEYSRYNGGWLKKVEGVDETKKGGYSILGDFVNAGDFEENYIAGLYLDCSKDGSRKNQEWNYHLIKITEKEEVEIIDVLRDAGRNYAVHFWKFIRNELESSNSNEEDLDVAGLKKEIQVLQEKLNKVKKDYEFAKKEALRWQKGYNSLKECMNNLEELINSESQYEISFKDIEGHYEHFLIVDTLEEAYHAIKEHEEKYYKYYTIRQSLSDNTLFYEVLDSKINSQGVFDRYKEVRDLKNGYKLCLRTVEINQAFKINIEC